MPIHAEKRKRQGAKTAKRLLRAFARYSLLGALASWRFNAAAQQLRGSNDC
jgi:hypothetical protein